MMPEQEESAAKVSNALAQGKKENYNKRTHGKG